MKLSPDERPPPRALVVTALGFFALVAQTLLFRDYLTIFEGNELGLGAFFGSWLLWITVGAWLAHRFGRVAERRADSFELLPLLYLPAFLLQQALTLNARTLAGVSPFELFPLGRMLPVALLVTAPVSLVTGWLFPRACTWYAARALAAPVSRVYIFESLGGFAGGLAVTGLLAAGVAAEAVCLLAGALVALAAARYRARAGRPFLGLALAAAALVLGTLGPGRAWQRWNDLRAWTRLLPREAYRGSFVTPQAKYLFGEARGQLNVLAWETIAETVPEAEHAGEVAALALAQQPGARRVLLVGPGAYAVGQAFLRLPQIERVTWLHPDPDYPRKLLAILAADRRPDAQRLELPGVDARRFLRQDHAPFDLVLLYLPDATTLTLNRYFTREFFSLLKPRLAPGGVVAARVSGGENYLGRELAGLGTAVYATLGSLFAHTALKPGDESWIFAADGSGLSEDPAALRDRFAALPGAAGVYPPEGVLALYPADRIAFQKRMYRQALAAAPRAEWMNTDARPRASYYSLLLVLRQSGWLSAADRLKPLARPAPALLLLALAVFAALRVVFKRRAGGGSAAADVPGPFDTHFLVFSTGLAAMALDVLLLYLFQARAGSLFLHVGLLTALFMLGLAAGAALSVRLLRRGPPAARGFLLAVLALETLLLAALALGSAVVPAAGLAALLFVGGALSGAYVPVAAQWQAARGARAAVSGSLVEQFDNLGGALGGWLTGLVLLPLLGAAQTAAALAALVLVNLPALVRAGTPRRRGAEADRWDRPARAGGYVLFGLAVLLLAGAAVLRQPAAEPVDQELLEAIQALRPEAAAEFKSAPLGEGRLTYAVVRDGEQALYAFSTDGLAPGVYGHGGPIVMVVLVEPDGRLEGFRVLKCDETPEYFGLTEEWQRRLVGHNLFRPDDLARVDTVSGATLSSRGIALTLQRAGQTFEAAVLGGGQASARARGRFPFEPAMLWFAGAAAAAVFLRRRPSRLGRRLLLAAVLVVFGLWMNLQYSPEGVFDLLTGQVFRMGLTWPMLFTLAVPALVLLFGNLYCGALCPFGAAQELAGDLLPARFRADPRKAVWRFGRWVKYALLFALVAAFALTASPWVYSSDLLVSIFSPHRTRFLLGAAVGLLALSLFFRRFWCRNLCPTGAFLSLLNGVHLLRRFLPRVVAERCCFGVRSERELDCLVCDLCRMGRGGQSQPAGRPGLREAIFLALVLAGAALVLGRALTPPPEPATVAAAAPDAPPVAPVVPGPAVAPAAPVVPPAPVQLPPADAGAPVAKLPPATGRPANTERIQRLLRQGRLSDREALHYRRLEPQGVVTSPAAPAAPVAP